MSTFQSPWDSVAAEGAEWRTIGEDLYANLPNRDIKALGLTSYQDVGGDMHLAVDANGILSTSVDIINGTGLVFTGTYGAGNVAVTIPILNGGGSSLMVADDINNDRDTPISVMTALQYDTSGTRQFREHITGTMRFGWNHRNYNDNGHFLNRVGEGLSDHTGIGNYAFGAALSTPWCFERIIKGSDGYLRADPWTGSFPAPDTMTLRDRATIEPARAITTALADWSWDPVTASIYQQFSLLSGAAIDWTLFGTKVAVFK